jgi:hypothetical protein
MSITTLDGRPHGDVPSMAQPALVVGLLMGTSVDLVIGTSGELGGAP